MTRSKRRYSYVRRGYQISILLLTFYNFNFLITLSHSSTESMWTSTDHVLKDTAQLYQRKRGGVVVERTPNREILGSIPQAAPCCVFEQDTLTPYSTG